FGSATCARRRGPCARRNTGKFYVGFGLLAAPCVAGAAPGAGAQPYI
ncbi:hypothetical protein A2U01_0057676, partial [Trifolium medium]|nr:hypothetical protein [Trifolium medium]